VKGESLIYNPQTSFPNNEPTDVELGIKPKSTGAWYYFIMTFDPQMEVFGKLLLVDSLAKAIYSSNDKNRVIVVQNSTKPLTLYSLIYSEESYCTAFVWVMDRYGITESWNQIFTFNYAHNYISSNLFGFNLDIHKNIGLPFLLFHVWCGIRQTILGLFLGYKP